jgi:hypothetical protein
MYYTICILLVQLAFILFAYIKLKSEEENYIFIKIIGYSILGSFKLSLNNFPIPLGFIIYLMFLRPKINIKSKQISALLGLVIFVFGIAIPYFDNIYFMRTRAIETGPISFNNMGIDDSTLFKNLKTVHDLHISHFSESFNKDGEVQSRRVELVDYYSNGGFIRYELNFNNKNKYLINAQKVTQAPEFNTSISYSIS